MPPPAPTCRRIPSSYLVADASLPVPVDQIGDRSIAGFALIDPNAVLLFEQGFGAQRAERDFVAFVFELKGVTCAEVEFLAQCLGNQDAPSLVQSNLRSHDGSIKWENPPLQPIFAYSCADRLLRPQRDRRVHAHGTPCRQIARP